MLIVKLKSGGHKLYLISIYSPEDSKPKQERETFHEELQKALDAIPEEGAVIIMGDFNACILKHLESYLESFNFHCFISNS